MQYRYSAKNQMDQVKASLKNPEAGASSSPRSLLDAMNYASHFPGFRPKVKFRSKQGDSLRIGTTPSYSRDPQPFSQLPENKKFDSAPPDGDPYADDMFSPPSDRPPPVNPALAFAEDEPVVKVDKPRISTHVLSGILGTIVAVAVGMTIGGGSSFTFKSLPATGNADNRSTLASGNLPAPSTTALPNAGPENLRDNGVPNDQPAFPKPLDQASDQPVPLPTPALAAQPDISPEAPAQSTSESKNAARDLGPPAKSRKQATQTARQANPLPELKEPEPIRNAKRTGKRKSRGAARSTQPNPSPAPVQPYSDQEPSYTAQRPANKRTQYARCEQVSGLFRREQCKWRVCDGKWGRDGCPAYKHNTNPYIGRAVANERFGQQFPKRNS